MKVRAATADDAPAVAKAVEELLIELGGERPSATALEEAVRRLAEDPEAGALLVAEEDERLLGVLAASWQYAIHVPGRYGTIQDLWVHPEWRSRSLGRELILALVRSGERGRSAATRGRPAAGELRPARRDRTLLPRERLPAAGAADAEAAFVNELLMVEQRGAHREGPTWILEGGQRLRGMDDRRRIAELRSGLVCQAGVRAVVADAATEDVERALAELHEREYLEALHGLRSEQPVTMPELSPPGLPPDVPVSAGLVAAAREGVRTAIAAATRLVEGARFSYALCRPPGHHAGPNWFAGYCYLNSAAAAALTLRDEGLGPVGILDLDLHYPNGTAAIVERMEDVRLQSLHAWPVTNVAARTVTPSNERERAVEFSGSPGADTYLDAVERAVSTLAASCGDARRLARLRHDRRRPAWQLGLLADDLRPDRPPAGCRRPPGLRRPGGRLRAAGAGLVQLRLRRRPARRGGGARMTFQCAFPKHTVAKAHRKERI